MIRSGSPTPTELDDLLDAEAYDDARSRPADRAMPYGPHTTADRERMLAALGIDQHRRALRRHPGRAPGERARPAGARAGARAGRAGCRAWPARNRTDLASFLGAGVYRHWSPPAVDQLLLRGEWYTAYTPYQPEVSQGTLQTHLRVRVADRRARRPRRRLGLALRRRGGDGRGRADDLPGDAPRARLVSAAASTRTTARRCATYFGGGLELEEIPLVADGDAAGHDRPRGAGAAARRRGPPGGRRHRRATPISSGSSSRWPRIGELAHAAGALFVAVVEPVSLAVLAPPGAYGADIAAGEGQPLGIAPQYGGPYLGILASTDALVRQIPGRLVGMTTDLDGQRAFVMTLRAREQDIRRDKAASNICTNQALLAWPPRSTSRRSGRTVCVMSPRLGQPARPSWSTRWRRSASSVFIPVHS